MKKISKKKNEKIKKILLENRIDVVTRPTLRTVVKELNATGNLALFVGAGLSMGCGLPSWSQLVNKVLAKTWKDQPEVASLLLKDKNILVARYARRKAGEKFNRIVHDVLYEDEVVISKCMFAIAKSNIQQICNFNFDDLLEEALQTEGVNCVTASSGERFKSTHNGVTVYHPHGILPRFNREAELDNAKIIFSEDDYHNLYSDPYSWANIAQISLLTNKSVLFIGLSMQDPNLRRLIDLARSKGFFNQHFAIFKDPVVGCKPEDIDEYKRIKRLIEIDMSNLGVTPWFVDSYDKITEILEHIAKEEVVS